MRFLLNLFNKAHSGSGTGAMASSSSERSRSGRRSPTRRSSPAGGTGQQAESNASGQEIRKENAGKALSPDEEKQRRSRGSGAVANRRQAGDPDTFQCPHCWRVIADNECAKEQHWHSLHCRTKRYQYSGYGDEKTCRAQARADMEKGMKTCELKENAKSRGREPPPEPRGEPSWKQQDPDASKRRRSRERARSSGRNRTRGRERSISRRDRRKTYGAYEVDRDGKICNRSGRWDDGIEIDKHGRVVTRGSNAKGEERDRDRRSRAPARLAPEKKGEKKATRSAHDRADGAPKGRAREPESEEYSYSYYEDSSPAGEEAAKKPRQKLSEDTKGKPRSAEQKKDSTVKSAPPVVAKAGSGAAADAAAPVRAPDRLTQSVPPAGNIEHRQDLYNSLLRTAMEAVKRLE